MVSSMATPDVTLVATISIENGQKSQQIYLSSYSWCKNIFGRLLQEDYEIILLDLHGHSRKLGSFIYGCKTYD